METIPSNSDANQFHLSLICHLIPKSTGLLEHFSIVHLENRRFFLGYFFLFLNVYLVGGFAPFQGTPLKIVMLLQRFLFFFFNHRIYTWFKPLGL
jgi:hypothetical protein